MKVLRVCAIAFIISMAGSVQAWGWGSNGHGHGHRRCESLVNDWSEWGSCTVTCEGAGLQIRTRQLVQSESCDSQEVPCPIPGQWNDWSDMGGCSVTCGTGEQVESRQCIGAQFGGTCTDTDGEPALEEWQTKSCSPGPCPVPGQWNDWSDMGGCSVTCGTGEQVESRQCIGAQNGGTCTDTDGEPALEECQTKSCSPGPCPVPGQWNNWSDMGGCSVTCGTGEQVESRQCTGAQNGGTCTDTDGEPALEEWQTKSCSPGPCQDEGQDDGSWSDDWTAIGGCSVTCGDGEQVERRLCESPPPQDGGACTNLGEMGLAETRLVSCNQGDCDRCGGGLGAGNYVTLRTACTDRYSGTEASIDIKLTVGLQCRFTLNPSEEIPACTSFTAELVDCPNLPSEAEAESVTIYNDFSDYIEVDTILFIFHNKYYSAVCEGNCVIDSKPEVGRQVRKTLSFTRVA